MAMPTVKCVLVGDQMVGKTPLLTTYVTNKFPEEWVPTTFDNYPVTVMVEDKPYTLDLWDVSVMDDYYKLRPLCYHNTDVFLICFSVVSPISFESITTEWVPYINENYPGTPFVLVGLQTDLRDDAEIIEKLSKTQQKPVTAKKAEKLAHKLRVKYVECSALKQVGVKDVFDQAILTALEKTSKSSKSRFNFSLPSLFRSGSKNKAVPFDKDAQPHNPEESINTIKVKQIELLDMIGQGGFGAVFRGKWKARKGEVVAVKKCTVAGTKDNPGIPQEVQILSALPEHPHIISFYAIAFNYPDIFIVTEFAEKGSLFNYLHKDKLVPSVDQSLTWALQVAQGMEHLHNHNIIHRDLKSANILLSIAMAAKICDFGTARYLSHTTVQTREAGTHRWMAPEVIKAVDANINKKCDSFSFGMVVYELFVHKVPYYDVPGDTVAGMKVLQGERPSIPPTVPKYLHSFLMACWEADPHKRPTFHDIVQALQNESF